MFIPSQNMPNMPAEIEEAIFIGMSDYTYDIDVCANTYFGCQKSLFNIVISTFSKMMPKWTRKKTNSQMY